MSSEQRLQVLLGGRSAGEWASLARELELEPDRVVERVAELSRRMPDSIHAMRRATETMGLRHPVLGRLAKQLTQRANRCQELFGP